MGLPSSDPRAPLRVLILSQFFDPEPILKGMAFAQELREQGCEVEVLTGFPNYPGGRLYSGYHIRPWRREIIDGISVTRVALYPSHDRSVLGRIMNYASFALAASVLGPALVTRPDVIYVYHPPITMAAPAMALRLRFGAPFVYEIQDLWPDTLSATGMFNSRRLLRLLEHVCLYVYRHADRVVVISEGIRSRILERGVEAARVAVVPNWCDERRIQVAERDDGLEASLGLEPSTFRVMFAGTMGLAQGMNSVLDAAELCQQSGLDVQFVLVGGGIERDHLREHATARALNNVRWIGQQPMKAMGPILALADALLVHLRDDPLFEITIPSKTQVYLRAGIPVIMAVKGDAAEMVRESGAGLVCPPEQPAALARAIGELMAMSPDDRKRMGERGRRYYAERLSLRTGTATYVRLLREMVVERRSSHG